MPGGRCGSGAEYRSPGRLFPSVCFALRLSVFIIRESGWLVGPKHMFVAGLFVMLHDEAFIRWRRDMLALASTKRAVCERLLVVYSHCVMCALFFHFIYLCSDWRHL